MKKLWVVLLAFLFVGCGQTTLTIDQEEIQEVSYGSVTLLKKEHETISDYFQELPFKQGSLKEEDIGILTIVTNTDRYLIHVTKDHHLYYEKEGKTYYSKDPSIVDFVGYLENIKETYLDREFYTITETNEYQVGNNDVLIKLDTSDHYLIIISELTLTDFRIHKIEQIDNEYRDVDLLYQNELIEQNHRIIIRSDEALRNAMIRITFTTPYHYELSLIPTYDEESGELTFQKEFKEKENS